MEQAAEYVVRVKAWPAYALVVIILVAIAFYGFATVWMLGADLGTWAGPLLAIVILGGLTQIGAMVCAVRRVLVLVRHPPRLTAAGIQRWLLPARAYPLLPWTRVAQVSTATKGLGRGMFIHVYDPEELAGGDPGRWRKLQREMRRFFGAPFVYPVRSGAGSFREIDEAVRYFSRGRHALGHGTRHG